MIIKTFASGSTGNCAFVSCYGTHLLLDAGISARKIVSNLRDTGIDPSELTGILISHEHSDHISGLRVLLKYADVPVYAPGIVADFLRSAMPEAVSKICDIPLNQDVCLGEVEVRAFNTPHDTPQSAGYRITGDAALGFCTDLGYVSADIIDNLTGVDICLLESNHDIEMLRFGKYPAFLKRRILSDRGHLSNVCSAEFAVRLAESGAETLILAHLSRENNTPDKAYATACASLEQAGLSPGNYVFVHIAPEDTVLKIEINAGKQKCSQ